MKKILFSDIFDLTDNFLVFILIILLFVILFFSSFFLFNFYLIIEYGISGIILCWFINFNVYIPIYKYFFDYFNIYEYCHVY